jgi:hypothetical protein
MLAKNCIMRSIVICALYQTFKGYQIKEVDIGEACSMHGKWCMCIKMWLVNCIEMFVDGDNTIHSSEILEMYICE